jgi:hypothetical protein
MAPKSIAEFVYNVLIIGILLCRFASRNSTIENAGIDRPTNFFPIIFASYADFKAWQTSPGWVAGFTLRKIWLILPSLPIRNVLRSTPM